ncbi:MAG: alpha/beta hydrolase family protein [Flavonifractor plautii]
MAADGIATLRIDFMGNGDSTASYRDYNYTSAVIDAKAAADYLAGLETVDGGNLGVMGWSQGGTDALLAAEAHPDTFQAVVTWSGALELNGASCLRVPALRMPMPRPKKRAFIR